jgi:hypothetical protein
MAAKSGNPHELVEAGRLRFRRIPGKGNNAVNLQKLHERNIFRSTARMPLTSSLNV